MGWLGRELFSFPEDPISRKSLSVRATVGQVSATAGQPSPAAKVHPEALFESAEISCSGAPPRWKQFSAPKNYSSLLAQCWWAL